MYYILLGALTIIWRLSMVFQFIDVIVIRFKYHEAFTRLRLAPDWVFDLSSVIGLAASGVSIYATVTAPWVPNFITVGPWDTWIVALVAVSLIAGAVIYFIGHARIKTDVTGEASRSAVATGADD